jgi:hypothetical protein
VLPDALPDRVHTCALAESTISVTGRPELAVADTDAEPPTVPDDGASKEIDWGFKVTAIACLAWAAAYVPLPGWLASITQEPAAA